MLRLVLVVVATVAYDTRTLITDAASETLDELGKERKDTEHGHLHKNRREKQEPSDDDRRISRNGTADTGVADMPDNVSKRSPAMFATKAPSKKEEEVEPFVVFYFMFTSLLLGTLSYALHHKYHLPIPYTVLLFVEGVIIGGTQKADFFPREYSNSVNMWVNMDPELILYAFLPALLFGEAMVFSWHVFKRAFGQCVLLAGPGVIFGTVLQTLIMRFIVPSWGWDMCMAFGAIVAATDPVAVVALLKDLGVDRMLTMQVAGESLLNDGVAIVVWTPIQLYMVATYCLAQDDSSLDCNNDDANVTASSLILLFLRLAVAGCILGKMFGWLTVLLLSFNSNKTSHASATIQLSLSLCCAYLSFFIGQSIFGVSGVLCCIFAGVFCGQHQWPIVTEKSAMLSVWHMAEFAGNTLLFILAGTIFGLTAPHEQSWEAWMQLFATYITMMVIRLLMLFMLFPILKRWGVGCSQKDLYIMWWGGLRGAVGLSLALYMRRLAEDGKIEREYGEKCVWLVAGCAALTLLINATTCSALIDYLNIRAESPQSRHQLLEFVKFDITKSTIRKLSQLKKTPTYGAGWIDEKWVAKHVSAFQRRDELLARLLVMIADDKSDSHLRLFFVGWKQVCNPSVNSADTRRESIDKMDSRNRLLLPMVPMTRQSYASGPGGDVEIGVPELVRTRSMSLSITSDTVRELRAGMSPSRVLVACKDVEDNTETVPRMELEMRSFSVDIERQIRSEPAMRKSLLGAARDDDSDRGPEPTLSREEMQDERASSRPHTCSVVLEEDAEEKYAGGGVPVSPHTQTGVGYKMKESLTKTDVDLSKSNDLLLEWQTANATDLLMERELFLSMLRSEYWSMIKDGRLPERSEAGNTLLNTVDSAEDVMRWALSDLTEMWEYLTPKRTSDNTFMHIKTLVLRFFYAVFVETPSRGAGFKRYVPCRTKSGRVIDLFTVVGFLDAHLEVCKKLSGSNSRALGYVTHARREVLLESNTEVEDLWLFLDKEMITKNEIILVRSKQLCSMLLKHEAEEIEGYFHSGLLKVSEYEELLQMIEHDLKRLSVSKEALRMEAVHV
eukprot:GEMP01002494.1.p1 GENE.GEMP01002494.1~~GEMP01002494.1.p1  ORF type:complete len:1068 (+),score=187.40 GEMP01002494.1:33-3236(+)